MPSSSDRQTTALLTSDPIVETTSSPEAVGGHDATIEAGTSSRRDGWVRFLERHGLGLLMALATTVMMAWGLARSALWIDEGASVAATQRSWADLWILKDGPEAPHLSYYALLKVFALLARHVAPVLTSHPEVLFRLPSVIVTVLAGWALIAWMNRRCPPRLVLATGAMLLLIGGFSRYGQEARPFAAVMLAAVVSTIAWSVLITDPRRRWVVAYALSITAMVALNTLSAGLVLAHAVAAIACTEPGQRWSAFLRTSTGVVLGLLLAVPLTLITAQNGTGPMVTPDVTIGSATGVFVQLFTKADHPLLGAGSIILLAAIGLLRVNSEPYRFIARLAACWALVPTTAMLLIVLARPNLLLPRYLLFVVPAWAILAGLGVVTLAGVSQAALARWPRSASLLAAAVTLALVAGVAIDQASTLRDMRTPAGHGDDIRPGLALAVRPEYAGLPLVIPTYKGAILVGAYARTEENRLVLQRSQRTEATIWPIEQSTAASQQFLRKQDRVILLQRASISRPKCTQERPVQAAEIQYCMPNPLKAAGYRVERMEPAGDGWAVAILKRSAKPKPKP